MKVDRMQYDLIVVGGGIVGLGHAWAAAKQGQSVVVFEAGPRAEGASIRNFGMIWPIGQPAGVARTLALQNARLWQEMGQLAKFPVERCGSLFLAHHADEMAVLEEFATSSSCEGLQVEILSPEAVSQKSKAINQAGLQGALLSESELRIHPPTAISAMTACLADRFQVNFHFNSAVTLVDSGVVTTAEGVSYSARRIIIASGAYFRDLFPEVHTSSHIKLCKLQMLMTVPQPSGWKLGPHLASGLTLRHYHSFEQCPSLAAVRERISATMPELDRYGIHVMASQTASGELILGDSHEYGDDIEPFDKTEIDALILREIQKVMSLPKLDISRRWHGLYAKHPTELFLVKEVKPDVLVVNGFAGNGMTLGLAVADNVIRQNGRDLHLRESKQ